MKAKLLRGLAHAAACHDLPQMLPDQPMHLLRAWFEDARQSGRYRDHNAMTLATATADGIPAARIVLCTSIETQDASLVFFCEYTSRKGREIESNPHAACVFHWPHEHRQVRIEGRVERTSDEENDAYFSTRPLLARVGAKVHAQLHADSTPEETVTRGLREGARSMLGTTHKRPPNWGGYRIFARRVELWSGGNGRLHDRAVWEVDHATGRWAARRLGN